jgi:hypothetical protein
MSLKPRCLVLVAEVDGLCFDRDHNMMPLLGAKNMCEDIFKALDQ